mmetsp:Transcript_40966/g.98791  ORF Transcript_40966/g.98791 Transcript_40966/m.98791 type:complete len:244 (-) Transcript_40966:146-877(-)|eukprot:CAMPEP_0113631062 /NCGR_PEP_ID=MMETSP0017_2-20120614/16142_1 /TAXON_ID=2856 /ORGANISM="Cylindrotheca closterium" /LENGTH=243 /DNA_ID=CAMNT_0000541557 /DNA_START=96 /DNA_END=827 /DNA_ORIENTATION=- /assembly_acc=CAM_ASM_000147
MRPDPEGTHQDSPSSHKEVQTVEKEQLAPEGHHAPTLDRAGLERTRSIMDDDEVENDTEGRTLPEDEKNVSILDADDVVVPQRAKRSSSISGLQLAESKEWENTSVQQPSCPTCQDGLQFTTGCEDQLVEQFQFVSACRHPRDFLTIFQEHADSFDGAEHAVAGFYHIPKECEYCGAASTKFCPNHCTRPKSFFQRKRPPFCVPGKAWDSKTDIEIVLSDSKTKKVEVDAGRSPLRSLLLFGR